MTRLLLILPLFACPIKVLAQLQDDFEDRDLSANPEWVGTLSHWISEDYSEGVRLRTAGPPASDTLHLFAGSVIPYGSWSVTYGYDGGPLSNFNQARIHLWSDGMTGETGSGAFLTIGTNDRTVKLYTYDQHVGNRRLVGSAIDDLLVEESAQLSLFVERTYDGSWRVWLNGAEIVSEPGADAETPEAAFFGIWIKHSAARGGHQWLDNIRHTPAVRSDTVAPALLSAAALDADVVEVRFTEPVRATSTCHPARFLLLPIDSTPVEVRCLPELTDRAELVFASPLPPTVLELVAIDIQDPSGNLRPTDTLRFSVPVGLTRPTARDIVVNEIDFSPQPPESEFVELYNRSAKTFDLSRIEIADDRTRTPIAASTLLLPPDRFAVVCRDSLVYAERFAPRSQCVEPPSWPSLNNSGDQVLILADPDTIDLVTYDPEWGSGGLSLERRDPDGPSDFSGNWGPSIDPLGATPGIRNSIFAIDRTSPKLVFAEQDAFNRQVVNAFFDEAVSAPTLTSESFTLAGSSARSVLAEGDGYPTAVAIDFDVVRPGDVVAIDVSDAWGNVSTSSSTRLHLIPQPGSMIVNEIHFEPLQDEFDGRPDQPEFVELRSLSKEPLALSSCVLAGSILEDGTTELLPPNTQRAGVPSSGFAILVAQGESDLLTSAFPTTPPGSSVIPLKASQLRLRNNGDRVAIGCSDGFIDELSYSPEWHSGEFAAVRGRSLERIDASASSEDPNNWTTSLDPAGATPGRHNSVSAMEQASRPTTGELMVTEIMFEPHLDRRPYAQPEYLELFNASDRPVDLNGIYLTETNSGVDSVRLVYAPTILGPGAFALVLSMPGDEEAIAPRDLVNFVFPSSASAEGSVVGLRRKGFRLSNTGGSLTLRGSNTNVIESFRYAPEWHHPYLAETRGVSLERISLSSRADDPRNWSSSVNPDGGTPGRENSVASSPVPASTGLDVTPSPFSPNRDGDRDHTVISYTLSSDRPSVRITIYDSRGWVVRRISDGELSARTGSAVWDGRDDNGETVPTGPYIVRLSAVDAAEGIVESHKKVVVVFSALN